jgi:lysophospholipase
MHQPAPYYDDVSRGPKGGRAAWMRTSDGVRIRVGLWPAEGARGTVLIFPGRTEYIEKYSDTAREFTTRGLASAAIDWRGQGLADRAAPDSKLGHVTSFDEYQRDVDAALEIVREAGLPEPYYLFAHSMGGCIGLRSLMRGLPVKAAAFSAPMWGLELKFRTRVAAWIGSTIAANTGLAQRYAPGTDAAAEPTSMPFEDNPLTRDQDMFSWMQSQTTAYPELLVGGPSMGWLNAALRETHALAREAAPDAACACWLGTAERIVEADAIHIRMNAWTGSVLHIVEGAEHEVAMEGAAIRGDLFDGCAALFV